MSTSPESGSSEFELDLDLHFLPAWAQKPSTENKYAKFEGRDTGDRQRRGDYGGGRDQRRGDRPPPRRDQPRTGPPGARPSRPGEGRRDGGGGRFGGPQQDRSRPFERREPAPPPIELNLTIIPEDKGVESLARQIRLTGRAYPLFDVAALVLKKSDRYVVRLNVIKRPDGQVAQPLFVCGLDDTLWLSEQEAVDYVLDKHFSTFYQTERIPGEPPKGTYTFVAQCGMSGTILGPPNYHDYQNKIRKLHSERFARMAFDVFKSRIKIVKDEATVKKWLDDQSWKTEFICLNVPEAVKLQSREEVEKHFREVHFQNVIKSVESYSLNGATVSQQPCRPLQNLVRRNVEEQSRFPIKVVNVLSQQFAGHGLQFFKVNKSITHVAVARPRYLDVELTPVGEGVRRIVDFIKATSNCSRRKILEALVPSASLQVQPGAEPGAPATDAATPPSPEAAAVISDLHWLVHQGHVIEFANGLIELAKKPVQKPLRPEPARKAPGTEGTQAAAEAGSAEGEVTSGEAEAGEQSEASESESPIGSEAPADPDPVSSPTVEPAVSPTASGDSDTGSQPEETKQEPGSPA